MLFNSFEFLIFFIGVYGLYLVLNHRWQNRLLIIASCLFYAAWSWKFLGLMFVSITTDYFCSNIIYQTTDQRRKNKFLLISLFVNLSILGFFKYFNFFAQSAQGLIHYFNPSFTLSAPLNILLPIGISFYTFEAISYTVDVYRGTLRPARKYGDYLLFVTYFPHLVAGPIMRAQKFLPQITSPRKISFPWVYQGCFLIFWGLYQKIFIADNLSLFVDPIFQSPGLYAAPHIWLALYAFAFQIYADFAGYSNMARGLGRVMGFDIMINFNAPYLAATPREFWHRWHISLSTWLRDYLYIPLGGNKYGELKTYRNVFLVMLLGGLWHGASWTFVIWGGYHGILLMTQRFFSQKIRLPEIKNPITRKITGLIGVVLFFHLVCIGWLFFRAQSLDEAMAMFNTISTSFVLPGMDLLFNIIPYLYLLLIMDVIQDRYKDVLGIFQINKIYQVVIYLAIAVSLLSMGIKIREAVQMGEMTGPKQFIYFQF